MTSCSSAHPAIGLALSSVIGNRTMSLRLADALSAEFGSSQDLLWFGNPDDYREFPAPRLLQISSQLESEYVFYRKLQSRQTKLPPVVVTCTLQVAAAVMAYEPNARLVVATDSTPAFTARLFHTTGIPRWKQGFKSVAGGLLGWHYRTLIRRVRAWLPMSEICKRSLVNDYDVAADACFVTRSPQLEIATAPPIRDISAGFKVLFVANDFVLKGGEALVAAARQLDHVKLTIISNDSRAKSHSKPGKIDVISGLKNPQDLTPYYRAADLLVHPTRRDCYSHVMCEALAQGCPVAVTDGTPPAEIVNESGAGWLIQRPADATSLLELLENVMSQPKEVDRRAEAALHYAHSRLSMSEFSAVVRGAVIRAVSPHLSSS